MAEGSLLCLSLARGIPHGNLSMRPDFSKRELLEPWTTRPDDLKKDTIMKGGEETVHPFFREQAIHMPKEKEEKGVPWKRVEQKNYRGENTRVKSGKKTGEKMAPSISSRPKP